MKSKILCSFRIIFVIILNLFVFNVYTQTIDIQSKENNGLKLEQNVPGLMRFSAGVSQLVFGEKDNAAGRFAILQIPLYGLTSSVGMPAMPVYTQLLDLPLGSEAEVKILSSEETEYDLTSLGILSKIFPAQASVSKSDDATQLPFVINSAFYGKNAFTSAPLVKIEKQGIMRGANLFLLSYSPVRYNPVTSKIRVVTHAVFEIKMKNADFAATEELRLKTNSPYVVALEKNFFSASIPATKSNLTQYPVSYVIVSDPSYQTVLQPFVQWKTKKGFKVIEAYTGTPQVGTTSASIKTYLQNLYNSATPSNPAFSFVLFVGDVAQIPPFSGTSGGHVTDLYFCEYTGDLLPEVYYGRFSANSIAELQPQIDKTLEYEKYLMPSTAFLNEVVLVSGVDASMAPIHGNGHINYITDNYVNSTTGFVPHVYLYPASGSSGAQIIQNVSSGVGFANYTAHCSASGWADPSFTTSHVGSLQNGGKYPFMIGNCCSSNEFNVNACFGEALLRAADKGAIGYIGGSNSTYWDEDFWWGVGFKNVVLNPAYVSTGLGAIDRAFHTHGEVFGDWFVTQGQINIAGNLAVQQSTSGMKPYYWEIYHLMGDPSLMPYFKVPAPLTITYNPVIPVGSASFSVTTEPYTYVALSRNGVLHAAGLSDAAGNLTLTVIPFTVPGSVDIVATKQNRQPHVSTINAIAPNGPYVVYNAHQVEDAAGNNNGQADYGENITLSVVLNNVGNQTAQGVSAKIAEASPYVSVTDSTQTFGNINAGNTASQSNAYALTVASLIPDQAIVPIQLTARDVNDSVWVSNFTFVLNAPVLASGLHTLADAGNADGILDAGEQGTLTVPVLNSGHAMAVGTTAVLQSLSPMLSIVQGSATIGNLNPGYSSDAVFTIEADTAAQQGTVVKVVCTVTASPYQLKDTITIVLGEIPKITMKDTTVTTCMAYFYDSGGETGEYSDDEVKTITFLPATTDGFVKVTFTQFDIEENSGGGGCWDELKVYNGSSTAAPLIGTYCGTTVPGPFVASQTGGALTFSFTSDYSVTRDGWVAEVTCYSTVGSEEIESNPIAFDVFPNPSKGLFNILCNGTSGTPVQYTVAALDGRVLIEDVFSSSGGSTVLDMSGFAQGVYILMLKNNGKQHLKKLLIF